eukprot:1376970-Pyramimonas_sp.AAC.1
MAAPRSSGQPAQSSAGQPAQSPAGQPAPALEAPLEHKEFWDRMRTSNRAKINAAFHPRIDDESERCMVAQYNVMDAAVLADQGAHRRVKQCATSCGSAQHSPLTLKGTIRRTSPGASCRTCSFGTWRRMMSTTDGHNYRSYSTDGLRKDTRDTTPKHLETVRRVLKDQHWACPAYAVLELIGMIDESGMKKNRLHIKKMKYSDMNCDAYFFRPSNKHSSPGIKCPESFYENYGPVRSWGTRLFHPWKSMGKYRVFGVFDYHAAPTTPPKRRADSLYMVAHTSPVTTGFSPAYASIRRS